MNLISADIPTLSCCLKYARTRILNTYMCLKLFKQKHQFSAMKSTITQVLLFHKRSVYPFPVVWILNPYHVEFLLMFCVCMGGGCFDVVVFVLLFFRVRAKTEIIFLPKEQNLEEYFHGKHI